MNRTTQEIRIAMANEAREILDRDGATPLMNGEENVAEIVSSLIDAYPEAKKFRPENPGYSFADFVGEFSVRVIGNIIAVGLSQTRGAIANRYDQ